MILQPEPGFADDFFWWIDTYADNSPPNCQGKFVLIYNREIRCIADTEDVCLATVKETGLEGQHYVIMAVGVESKRPHLEIPSLEER